MITKQTGARNTAQWVGPLPRICQLCGTDFRRYFVDARVPGETAWAIMCLACFDKRKAQLGLGLGQMYEMTEGRKIAG